MLITDHLKEQRGGAPAHERHAARPADPRVLIADDQSDVLEALRLLLKELHAAGATICMVTHDPRYARNADRSIHLFDGRVVEEDGSKKGERELEESGFDIAH